MSRTARRAQPLRGTALALLLACAGCAVGGESGALRQALDELVACPDLAGGRIGVIVVDAADGRVLAEHASDRGFAPASNMKLLTAAVALTTLTPEDQFATVLITRGEVRDGVLDGDLVLVGSGDPTFGEVDPDGTLAELVAAVRAAGITRIDGRVLGDGSHLGSESLGLGWQWDYLDEDYAAPFGGLCFAGNVVTVRVAPGEADPIVRASPAGELITADVQQGPRGSATRLRTSRMLGGRLIAVRGTIAADAAEQRLRVTIADPAKFAAASLARALGAAGISVTDRERQPGVGAVLLRHRSPDVASIVKPMLENSNNLYAEQLWRLAAANRGRDGSTAGAERHAKAVLASLGVDTAHMVLADGSGLSRRDLVQPRQLAQVLLAMHRSAHRDAFTAGLPVAGLTGTLRSRFPDGPARGRVRAKTGFISRVVCLSGYVPRPGPAAPPFVFSVMLNDFTCDDGKAKAAADAFVQRLATLAGW